MPCLYKRQVFRHPSPGGAATPKPRVRLSSSGFFLHAVNRLHLSTSFHKSGHVLFVNPLSHPSPVNPDVKSGQARKVPEADGGGNHR